MFFRGLSRRENIGWVKINIVLEFVKRSFEYLVCKNRSFLRENFKIKNLFILRKHVKILVPNVKRIPKTRQALSFRTLREESFERLNYTAYTLSALQCIRRKHQLRAA